MFDLCESEEIELKASFNNDVITREIVAFLNGHGGKIYIGVRNNKEVCGIDNSDEIQRRISDIVISQIEPSPLELVSTSLQIEEGREIVVVDILKGTHSLYCMKKYGFSQSGCPIRIGTSTKILALVNADQFIFSASKA